MCICHALAVRGRMSIGGFVEVRLAVDSESLSCAPMHIDDLCYRCQCKSGSPCMPV